MDKPKKKGGGWSATSRYHGEQSMADILGRLTSHGVIADKFLEVEVTAIYEASVGRHIARMTENLYVNKGKLFIKVNSSALKQELVYSRGQLLDLINEKLADKIGSETDRLNHIKEVIIL